MSLLLTKKAVQTALYTPLASLLVARIKARQSFCSEGSSSYKIHDMLSYLFPLILLEEVTSIANRNFRLMFRRRDQCSKELISASSNRVSIRKQHKCGLLPFRESFSRPPHLGCPWIVRMNGDKEWKSHSSSFVGYIWKWAFIS